MAVSTNPALLVGKFDRVENQFKVSAAAQPIIKANPLRVALILSCTLGGPVFIRANPVQGTVTGFQITNGTNPLVLTFAQVGALIGMEWYAGFTGVNDQLYICESIYDVEAS